MPPSWATLSGGGRSYRILGLYIHNVQVQPSSGGEPVVGRFLPVLFENMAAPILSGREKLGFSEIFADIDMQRTESSIKMVGSWGGVPFVDLELGGLQLDERSEEPALAVGALRKSLAGIEGQGVLHYKCIPATGQPGKADAAYPTLTPNPTAENRGVKSVVHERFVAAAEDARLVFKAKQLAELPTLWNVVENL